MAICGILISGMFVSATELELPGLNVSVGDQNDSHDKGKGPMWFYYHICGGVVPKIIYLCIYWPCTVVWQHNFENILLGMLAAPPG